MVQEHSSVTSNIFPLLQENSYCITFIHSQPQENLNMPATVFTPCVYSVLVPSQARNKKLYVLGGSNLCHAVCITVPFIFEELAQ